MNVATILKHKGAGTVKVSPETTLQEAARILSEKRIGAALVMGPGDALQGIVSERDIVRAVAASGASCLTMTVASVMTSTVKTCRPADTVDQLMTQMTEGRFRHVPVMEGGRLAGIVSIGDVVKLKIAETELEVSAIREYIAAH